MVLGNGEVNEIGRVSIYHPNKKEIFFEETVFQVRVGLSTEPLISCLFSWNLRSSILQTGGLT